MDECEPLLAGTCRRLHALTSLPAASSERLWRAVAARRWQELALAHFSVQPEPFLMHNKPQAPPQTP